MPNGFSIRVYGNGRIGEPKVPIWDRIVFGQSEKAGEEKEKKAKGIIRPISWPPT